MWLGKFIPKKNVHFSTKSKENLLLATVYESKKVNVGIKTQYIFQLLKEDTSIDMDVSDLYEHTSVFDLKVKFQK